MKITGEELKKLLEQAMKTAEEKSEKEAHWATVKAMIDVLEQTNETEEWEEEEGEDSWTEEPVFTPTPSLGLVIGYGEAGKEHKTIKIDSWVEFDDLHAALHAVERYKG